MFGILAKNLHSVYVTFIFYMVIMSSMQQHISQDAKRREAYVTDEVVLAHSIQNPDVFVYLVRRYEDVFLRKVIKIVWNKEDAEDVVQKAFTKIYLNAVRFKKVEGASFKSWAYTILMNTAYTKYQKRKKELSRTVDLLPEQYENLSTKEHENSFGLESSDRVLSILAKMPEHLSRVLELHFLKQIPQQAIAEYEGIEVGTIKTRAHRAKAQFRKLVEQYTM